MTSRPAKRCRKRIKLDRTDTEDSDDNHKSKYRLIYQKRVSRHYYLYRIIGLLFII